MKKEEHIRSGIFRLLRHDPSKPRRDNDLGGGRKTLDVTQPPARGRKPIGSVTPSSPGLPHRTGIRFFPSVASKGQFRHKKWHRESREPAPFLTFPPVSPTSARSRERRFPPRELGLGYQIGRAFRYAGGTP